MSLDTYLCRYAVTDYEGNSGQIPAQTARLVKLVQSLPSCANILEIGFNAGHSANTFLSHSLAHVTSFDLGDRQSVPYAKKFMDLKYPTRHTLIIGDSTQTIPEWTKQSDTMQDLSQDLLFIDGGHTYEIAMADIMNCKALAHKDTIVVIDDVCMTLADQQEWTLGPTKAWSECMMNGIISMEGSERYAVGRGMCWGKYIQ
jgi:predicted O-methyltransferase YrrM